MRLLTFLAIVNGRSVDCKTREADFQEYKERIELANDGNYSALMALKARTAKMKKKKELTVFQRLQIDTRKGKGVPQSQVFLQAEQPTNQQKL